MGKDRKVIVIGHRNPDTDSICSAVAYAYLKNKINGGGYEACRAGEISQETEFVLKRFKTDAPRRCVNVYTQVDDMDLFDVPGLAPDTSMRAAWLEMRDTNSASQPVIDENGELLGMITLNDLSRGNMDNLSADALAWAKTPVRNIVEILHGTVLTGDIDQVIEKGSLGVGAGAVESMETIIEEGDITIVSNRFESQIAAVESGAAVLIICLSPKVSKTVIKLAKERGTTVIVTDFDTFTASRIIVQSAPISAFMTPEEKLIKFLPNTPVTEVSKVMTETRHVYFPVHSPDGKYLGLISRTNLLGAKGKQLILVDHNEKSQCVDGYEQAEILEIIDHHRIGSIETVDPVYFRNQPVGCTATIVTQMYEENGVRIPKNIAGLMLSAILSDTLAFKSPTCTPMDVKTAEKLSGIVGVEPEKLAEEIFAAGENLDGKSPEDVCYQDFKVFTSGDIRFGVGQASFMSQSNLCTAYNMLKEYLPQTLEHDNTKMAYFLLTDVKKQSSYMLFTGEDAEEVLLKSFNKIIENTDNGYLLKGVVSRKKQVIPSILDTLK